MTAWTEQDIPSLRGKRAVVTGGTSGIGRATASGLAAAGAEVILAGRNPARGAEAMQAITEHAPGASVCFEELDLACLASVASFAARISARHDTLDILVNNAGVMALPQRHMTADGFEMQFGVNYLGHFALTSLLLPLLRSVQVPRVVSVTSLSHRMGRIDFDDLQAERGYAPWKAYSQSKLALLIFALELQRRSDVARWGVTSLAAHPGWALTNLYSNGPASEGTPPFLMRLMRMGTRFFSHSAVQGAGPILFAATSPVARGGCLYGRRWLWEMRGPPALARIAPQAQNARAAARLWDVSAELTGQRFDLARPVATIAHASGARHRISHPQPARSQMMTTPATGLPRLNEAAPDFHAHTTHGDRSLAEYQGKWLVLFSHPADFTPVCTTEFIAFARAHERFAALNCDFLGLSIDSLFAHLAWVRNIEEKFGVAIPFPIIEDIKMEVAGAYGMVHPGAADTQAVRATFLIDPKGVLRAMLYYPMSNGRSIEEILRLLTALQTSDANGVATPEGWQPGEKVIVPPPKTAAAAAARAGEGYETTDWYFSKRAL